MRRIFVALVFQMVAVWSLLGIYWNKGTDGFRARLGGTVLVAVILVSGLWLLPDKMMNDVRSGKAESAPMVARVVEQGDFEGEPVYRLEVDPLRKDLFGGRNELFTVSSYEVDGGVSVSFPMSSSSVMLERWMAWNGSAFLNSESFREAFDERPVCILGNQFRSSDRGARALLSEDAVKARPLSMKVGIARHQVSWKKVADLPLKRGAHSGGWSLNGWEDFQKEGRRPRIRLSERVQRNWLRGDPPLTDDRSLRIVIVDQERNVCFVLEDVRAGQSLGALSAMRWRGFRVDLDRRLRSMRESELGHYRLMVFEPSSVQDGALTWEGQVEVSDLSGNPSGLANDKRVLALPDFDKWLKENPVPPETSSEGVVAGYLVKLLGMTHQLKREIPGTHEIVAPLALLAKEHYLLFARAIEQLASDQHYSRRLLEEVLAVGITQDEFRKNLKEMMAVGRVRRVAREKGWYEPLHKILAEGARSGNVRMLEEAILLPDKAGLSNEECVMLFNQKPRVSLYRVLSKNTELRILLQKEIDRALAKSVRVVSFTGGDIDEILNLALASGRPGAPKILKDVLGQILPDGDDGNYDFLGQYFEIDYRTTDTTRWLGDFLKTDSDRWVFDEGKGKYLLQEIESKK